MSLMETRNIMTTRTRILRFFGGLAVVVAVAVAGYLVIRPWHLRWGASGAEVAQAMPGDLDGARWTRAIAIAAPPEQVWPWLAQWGQGRGGWYSYDWLENLMGFDIHTADRIRPEFQNLAVGDPICMARNSCTSYVTLVEPNRWLSWRASSDDGTAVWNFTFGLYPDGAGRTRLVVRESFGRSALPPAALRMIEIPDVVMEQKALDTLKRRAEGTVEPPFVTAAEIGVWLAALAIGLVAGWLFVFRRDWRRPLAVGVAAVVVLLALTFTFPPLWLRALLDAALLAGLVWALRSGNRRTVPVRPTGLVGRKKLPEKL
jgi:hypothetical protein